MKVQLIRLCSVDEGLFSQSPSQSHFGEQRCVCVKREQRCVYLFGKGLCSIGLDKRHDIDGELISDKIIQD
jgi:hypothetical protein